MLRNMPLDALEWQAQARHMGTVERRYSVIRGSSVPASPSSVRATGSTVSVGSTMFAPEIWERIARNLRLSGRELQIVRGTFDDQTESAMAADLKIALSTVHTHVERLHHKLNVADRAQLLLRVMQEYISLTRWPGDRLDMDRSDRTSGRRSRTTKF